MSHAIACLQKGATLKTRVKLNLLGPMRLRIQIFKPDPSRGGFDEGSHLGKNLTTTRAKQLGSQRRSQS
jgi:hypothetical protein